MAVAHFRVDLGKTTNFGFLLHLIAMVRGRSRESFRVTGWSTSRASRVSVETKTFPLAIAHFGTYTAPLRR